MEAYATLDELESRWRTLGSADERARAKQKLLDASLIAAGECKNANVEIDLSDEATAALLSMTVCEMAKRAMLASADQAPATQGSVAVGPFSQSFTYANPTGDLYMTRAEKRRLGIGIQRAAFAHPWGVFE